METVEVVIRINKNTFDAINELSKFVDGNHIINGYQMKGHSTVGSMITAIAKGTVLPKGHDALLDARQLMDYCHNQIEGHKYVDCNVIARFPCVIKADKDGDTD